MLGFCSVYFPCIVPSFRSIGPLLNCTYFRSWFYFSFQKNVIFSIIFIVLRYVIRVVGSTTI
uniref:Uncharacterized protein n=1 Tax=Aegilops tauschii subsp. strangulata TaxID=200361 RepID=A0A453GCT8_AEGTS